MGPSELAYYLYCLTPSGRRVEAAMAGVDERHPVLVRDGGEMGAVFSVVELEDFVGPAAEARLQDLAWLGPRVCRHEAVIEQAMSRAPVLPARFATLFSSLDSLEKFILEHRKALAGFFAEIGDKQEWAVKGLLDRVLALEKLGQSTVKEQAPDASPGARYFQEKRMKAQLEREFNQRLRTFCQRAAASLGTHAGGFRERKVLTPVAEGTEAEVVMNWAFLIPPGAIEDFRASLERFNGDEAFPGLMLVLTGPWPPYSFVPDLSGGAEA
jgi:hypothetical protein